MIEHKDKHGNENMIEGRNAVLEAFRSGKPAARTARCGRLYVRQRSMILWFSL